MASPRKIDQSIEDTAFIVTEVNRFLAMDMRAVMKHTRDHPEDMFATLPHPKGGHLYCGRRAFDRFQDIAERALTRDTREKRDFDPDEYLGALRSALGAVFLVGRVPVNESNVSRMLSRAAALASKTLVHVTHHIPCVIFHETEPLRFSVGPVAFASAASFLAEKREALEQYEAVNREAYLVARRKQKPETSEVEAKREATTFSAKYIDGIRQYYRQHYWVASVEIPPCHSSLSLLRAERTIDGALDVLRLFVPTSFAHYRRATAPGTPFDTRELMTTQSGTLVSSGRWGARGGTPGTGWYGVITKHAARQWSLFEAAIASLATGEKIDELAQRLQDALHWFGQGVVEPNSAAAVVKYTAALERLTITGHVDGLEALVVKRTTALRRSLTSKVHSTLVRDLGYLYQLRSDLMHGSKSPYDADVEKARKVGWESARQSLLTAAEIFAGLRSAGEANRKALARAYDDVTRDAAGPVHAAVPAPDPAD
ncbi:MAG TPA: HEPN domain-containing protein [Thermoanaerobaculia bacterium]|nr:HEPN domain-containing protein [Thermoanaerobaculia bacterium]